MGVVCDCGCGLRLCMNFLVMDAFYGYGCGLWLWMQFMVVAMIVVVTWFLWIVGGVCGCICRLWLCVQFVVVSTVSGCAVWTVDAVNGCRYDCGCGLGFLKCEK